MKKRYKVHKFDASTKIDQIDLELFINDLKGEIVAIIPNISSEFTLEGLTDKLDYLLIVEKLI